MEDMFMDPWMHARSALKAGTKFFKETGFKSFVIGNQFDFYNFIKDKSIFNNATVKLL